VQLRKRLIVLLFVGMLLVGLPAAVGLAQDGTIGGTDASPKTVLTNPYVSEPVLPVDTRGLPPAAPLEPFSGEPQARPIVPLPGAERTANAPASLDPVVQSTQGTVNMPAPIINFEGIPHTGVFPPDTNGVVGPNHYVQVVNAASVGTQVRVWDKAGNLLYDFGMNNMWPDGDPCNTAGYGDPVVLYDQLADRWVLTQFALPNPPYYECFAVSKTGVPTNNPNDWYLYSFLVHQTKMNDYPKLGVWPDGYYMSANQFTSTWAGAGVWVFDRAKMLNGQAATFQYFDLANMNINYGGLLPSNLQGLTPPPVGAPNYFMSVDMDWSGTDDILHIFEFHTDWNTPSNSTFTLVKDLVVAPFDWNFSAPSGAEVPQPDTSQGLDNLADRLMMHLWYRNFGDHESLVVNHTVNVGGDRHGIRWYEIRGGTVNTTLADATIYQQGTFAPADSEHRWMGSIAMDHMGNMALGYSVSSSTVYPSIRYAGRLADDPLNTLPQAEEIIIVGTGSQTGSDWWGRGRWGDYSAMSVDPVDDCTFWFTTEYMAVTSFADWQTRIAAFKFPNCRVAQGYVDGTVYDGTMGGGLEGAIVQVISNTVVYTDSTAASGYYTMTVAPDTYTVTAWKYGYTQDTRTGVTVVTDTVTTVNLTLTRTSPYTLTGCVTDSVTSAPLSATVSVIGPFGNPVTQTKTQATGCYTLTLYGGQYTVTAEARLHTPAEASVNLTSDTVQNFALLPTTTDGLLWGYITNLATGKPIEEATIQVSPGLTATQSLADGYYEMQLPSGIPYTVTVSAHLYSTVSESNVILPQSNLLRRDYALPTSHMVLLPPKGISVTLRIGKQTTETLVISNTGSGGLDFAIREIGDTTFFGGPDPFGYTFQDNSVPQQGATYEWIDATDGTPLGLSDDGEANVTLPFPFTFYGTTATAIRVSNNGGVIFNATSGDLSTANTDLGSASTDNLIVPLWDDIDSDTGDVYYKTVGSAPNRRFVIEWYDRPRYNNIGDATFEMILYEGTNNIKFQYQDVDFGNPTYDYGASATVGIRGSGSNYLQYSYNQPVISDGLAICFRYPGSLPCDPADLSWLGVTPMTGTVAASHTLPISVHFSTLPITNTGVYTAFLRFATNDPDAQPYVYYPVTMTVLPPLPDLSIDKDASAMEVEAGLSLVYTLTVTNLGGPATGATITDSLPAHTTFAWADSGGSLVTDTVVWKGLSIPGYGVLEVTYGVTVTCAPSGTRIVNDDYWLTATDWPTPTTGLPVTTTIRAEGVMADFDVTPPVPLQDLAVSFTNLSHNATSYKWDLGDKTKTDVANPVHTYTSVGTYTVVLTASNVCSSDVFSRVISVENYDVMAKAGSDILQGDPGRTVTHTLYLTNTGTLSDVFQVSLGSSQWAARLSTGQVSLNPGEQVTIQVSVDIPSNVDGGDKDTVLVMVRSTSDIRNPAASASVLLTTEAKSLYSVDLGAPVVTQTAQVGEVVTFTLYVTNTSNTADTITFTRTNTGWPTTFSVPSLMIARGGIRQLQVFITVPGSAMKGDRDVAVIRATGSGGYDEVELTVVTGAAHQIYLPLVVRNP